MLVRELMTQSPHSCHVNESLQQVARVMWEHDCGAVPVVDDSGSLVGIVTDRDICMAAYTQGKPLSDLPVTGAMASDVVTCRGDDEVVIAERAMRDSKVRRLPVVDAYLRVIGILSLNDLAREALNTGHPGAPRNSDVAQTLAAICMPRSEMVHTPASRS